MSVRPTGSRRPADPSSADPFLRETDVVDWTAPEILVLARQLAADAPDDVAVARACFEWVRDEIGHSVDHQRIEVTCEASEVLRVGTGFCYAKSHLLVALLRANGLRAGFCYQRLVQHEPGGPFVLHGLAAVNLGSGDWYRIDPRGNKPGVDASFAPPVERLAFPVEHPGEILFPKVYADPAPSVLGALRTYDDSRVLQDHLPDAASESDLEASMSRVPTAQRTAGIFRPYSQGRAPSSPAD
jgi:transglutaminase-like putative cysteine protease